MFPGSKLPVLPIVWVLDLHSSHTTKTVSNDTTCSQTQETISVKPDVANKNVAATCSNTHAQLMSFIAVILLYLSAEVLTFNEDVRKVPEALTNVTGPIASSEICLE